MNRITTKPDASPPAPIPAPSEPALPPHERGLGWSIALGAWIVAFVVLWMLSFAAPFMSWPTIAEPVNASPRPAGAGGRFARNA